MAKPKNTAKADGDDIEFAIWYIAIPNDMPAKTGYPDQMGITVNPDVLDRCPLSWQRSTKDWFTGKQFDEMVYWCDSHKKQTGGWVAGKEEDASRNLLAAIRMAEAETDA